MLLYWILLEAKCQCNILDRRKVNYKVYISFALETKCLKKKSIYNLIRKEKKTFEY